MGAVAYLATRLHLPVVGGPARGERLDVPPAVLVEIVANPCGFLAGAAKPSALSDRSHSRVPSAKCSRHVTGSRWGLQQNATWYARGRIIPRDFARIWAISSLGQM